MSVAASRVPSPHTARIGGVTYLNAWPVLYGLMLGREPLQLRMAYPSVLAQQLVSGATDLALAPVATLALGGEFELAPGICIGADGPVASVLIVASSASQTRWAGRGGRGRRGVRRSVVRMTAAPSTVERAARLGDVT